MIDIDLRPKHKMAVPGIGVFIAPQGVARLFSTTDFTHCPPFLPAQTPSLFDAIADTPAVLYPLLLPNVLHCPRYYHVTTRGKHTKGETP